MSTSSSSSFSPIRLSVNKFQNFKLSFIRNYYHQSSVLRPKNLNEISLRNLRRQYYSREKNFNGWTVTSDLKFVSFGSHMIFFMMLPTVVHYYTSNSRVNVIRDDDLSLLANTDEDGINSNHNQNTYKPLNYKINTRIDDNLVSYLKDNRKNELTSSNINNNNTNNNNKSSETLINDEKFEINNNKDSFNSFNSEDNSDIDLNTSLPMTPMELEGLIDIPVYRTKPQRSLNRTHTLPDRLIQVYMVDEIMKNTVNKDDKLSNSIKTKLNKSGLTDCKSFISIKKSTTNEINKNNTSNNEIDRLRFIHNENDFQPIINAKNYNFTESVNEIDNYYKLINENKKTKTEYILFVSKKLNEFNLANEINFKNLSLKNSNNTKTKTKNKKFNKEFNILYKKLFIQLNSLKFYSLAQYIFRSFTVTRQNTLDYLNPINNSVKDKEIIKLNKLKSKIGKRFENSKNFKSNKLHNNKKADNNQLNNLENRVNGIVNYSKSETIKGNKNSQLNKTSENSRLLIHSNYLIKPDSELFDEILEHTIVIKAMSAFNQLLRLLGITVKTSDYNYNNEINSDNLSNEIYKVRSLIFNKSAIETNQKYLNSLIIALKGCYEFGKTNEANEIIEKLINYSLVNNSNIDSNINSSNNFSNEKLNEIKEILPNIILTKILRTKNSQSNNNDLIINWANQLSSICC